MFKITFISLCLITISLASSLYDFSVNDVQGKAVDFGVFRGKALLIVNVASQCGQTDSHYKALKRLYDILSYRDKFEILAFPSNDFGEQEPWEEKEIEEFVRGHFKAEFPLFSKVKVTGENIHPFWKYVTETSSISPSWNFQKYLFDKEGNFVKSWDSNNSIESIFEVIQGVINQDETSNNDSKIEL